MQSIVSGAPVTQDMLCAMLEQVELPPAKRLKVQSAGLVVSEPPQGDAQIDSQQAIVVSSQAGVASSASQAIVPASPATVAASQAIVVASQALCNCRGNCGMKLCKAAKNKQRADSGNMKLLLHIANSPSCRANRFVLSASASDVRGLA